ncbi:separase [Selaginella moellendorffii]|uniref:separase n=1 Tax=Selaginella moellendorffii TaxID=88036 RepID=UPI000D1CD3F6|nr:separase [Selaginella moellendorffii]|eukprot:XP_024524696.1 separase [Selaginella moellendorffii]
MAPAARGTARKARAAAPAAISSIAISEEGILARISSSESIAGLSDQVRCYLELNAKNSKESEGHARAKRVVPFLGRLLKLCSAELKKIPAEGDTMGYQRGGDLFGVVGVALESLDSLRPWLASGIIEIELQRYGFVRRLVSWKRYREAAAECRKILASLNARVFSLAKDEKARKNAKNSKNQSDKLVLPTPKSSEDMVPGLPALVVGVATDLILYTVESGERDIDVLESLARLPRQLEPWLSVMDSKDQGAQRDAVFKALYRSTTILIARSAIEAESLYSFCTIALVWCSISSQVDQYLKVARKFCSSPSVQENVALDLCLFVIASLRSKVELHLVSEEMLEESALKVQNLMLNSSMPSDELRGLISVTYNMGVQLYNKKEYDLACRPLKLAHDGTWIRVDFLSMISAVPVVEAVSEACVKTSAYVDCLVRNSDTDYAIEVLRNSLVYWLRVHSQGFKLESPQSVLKLWCKVTLEFAPELCCLYGSLCDLQPPAPAASLGLILEGQLLALDDTEKHGIEQVKEELISFLADEVYNGGSCPLELSRVLIEKGRFARKKGMQNLGTVIALLSKALLLSENALRTGEEEKVETNYLCAVAYCLRAHCSQEADSSSEEYVADLTSAVKAWRKFLGYLRTGASAGASYRMTKESILFLLRSMADLLSLKALTSLQNEIQLLIFEFISYWYGSQSSSVWENTRTSHVLCLVPLSSDFEAILQTKFGQKMDVLYDFGKTTDSLAAAVKLVLSEDLSAFSQQHLLETDAALTLARGTPNSFRERVHLSRLQFYLAEVFMQRGDLEMAIKLATESLQLRLKLLNRTFLVSKDVSHSTSKSKVEAVGPSAVLSWPSLLSRNTCYEFSQWHILGDYLESLMQVGSLHEKLGFSDEAERSFREGLWLAKAQNLTFSCIRFTSALGEVHRKQHMWEHAEEGLKDAEKMLEELNSGNVCAGCITMEKCLLKLRFGDLARHSPKLDGGNIFTNTKLDIGLMHYEFAIEALTELPFLREVLEEFKHASHGECRKFRLRDTTLSAWTHYKWEYHSRCLAAKLFIEQGSCRFQLRDVLKAEESYLQARQLINVEVETSEQSSHASINASLFPLEEANLLYNWSLLRLWEGCAQRVSDEFLSMPCTWLYRAFFLSITASVLSKKVCQLLAILHFLMLATNNSNHETKELAAYFHQASIGSMSRQQHLLVLDSKSQQADARTCIKEMRKALRVVQEGSFDLRAEFKALMDGLPSATICCISLLEQEFSFILEQIGKDPSAAWLLISRIGGDVVVTILPIGCANRTGFEVRQAPESRWRHKSVLESDALVRAFMGELASILDESRQSTSRLLPVSTPEEKNQWWKWRTELDTRLASCLRNIENSWLGFWKCLLLGEPARSSVSEALRKKSKELCRTLKSKSFLGQLKACKVPEEALVKLLLQAVGSLEAEQLRQGIAFILGWDHNLGEREELLIEKASEVFRSSFLSAINKELDIEWEPVELVLDGKLQALPWESLPVMRKLETYRMPSLGSIKAVFIHHRYSLLELDVCDGLGRLQLNGKARRNAIRGASRPAVNPHSTFYLLNPGGDLESTQSAFEEWFRRQKGWEGKTGQVPTLDEYLEGFQQHDMFVYLGHGSGDQYFPEKHMRKLVHCPASLLMGCSSGRFSARGDYEPVGVPLSYLMASCPLAIANLWDVTDGDIDRFSRAVLQRWLESCANEGASKPKIKTPVKAPRRGRSSSKAVQEVDDSLSTTEEWEEVCIGPSIEAGREACRLPYLIGASPVCFGVPTVIRRSKTDDKITSQ